MTYDPWLHSHRQNRPKPVDILARHIADYFDDRYHESASPVPDPTEQQLAQFLHDLGYRQVNP